MSKELQFDQDPEYSRYKQLFEGLLKRMGQQMDYVYDWDKLI
jgi:hypothetical protein